MSEPTLKAQLWVSAQIKTCGMRAIPIFIRNRGDADAGSILIKLDRLNGTSDVLTQVRGRNGERQWLKATGTVPVPDAEAEAYITRQLSRDPDIWVVEIEDGSGLYEADAPVVV